MVLAPVDTTYNPPLGFESAIAKGTLHIEPPIIPASPNCHNGSEPLAPNEMPKTGISMVNMPTIRTDRNRKMNIKLLDFRCEEFSNPTSDTIRKITTIVASNSCM